MSQVKSKAPNLLIVESPAKTKSITQFLGSDFRVLACMGQVRDPPADALGIDLARALPHSRKYLSGYRSESGIRV